ncbi:MAG: RHS repeat domain-containing protein, partial [Bacteroidota bacterium]
MGSLERPHQQLVQRSRDQNSQRRSRRQSTNPNVFPDPYYGSNAAPFQVQDPYDDPNDAYINNTMQGKIMLVRVQQQVVDASGSGNDTPVRYSPTNFSPQYPHPVRLLSQVNSRNRFGQVVEEEDNAGLKTRYVFSPADVIEYEDCYQDSIHNMVLLYLNENPGLPSEVIVGYGRSDAQVTRYEYDDRRRVAKLTDPAGTELTYEYDERGRLYRGYRNGSLLQEQAYSQWQNDGSLSFAQRSYQNYVQSTTYIDDTQSTSERSYLDPLGRQRGQVKDGSIVMGNSIYNNAGQLQLQLKPSVGSLPLIDFNGN